MTRGHNNMTLLVDKDRYHVEDDAFAFQGELWVGRMKLMTIYFLSYGSGEPNTFAFYDALGNTVATVPDTTEMIIK